jgi:hypothetical protein
MSSGSSERFCEISLKCFIVCIFGKIYGIITPLVPVVCHNYKSFPMV